MRILQKYELEYIRNAIRGIDRTNMTIHVVGDSHYRVYPSTVEYYSGEREQDYAVEPDETQRTSIGTNYFWDEF